MNCKDCIFAIKDQTFQTECLMRNIADTTHQYDEEGYWILPNYCQFKRDVGWKEQTLATKARQEVVPQYEIYFSLDNFNYDDIFNTFKDCRLAPKRIIGYTKQTKTFFNAKNYISQYSNICGLRLIEESVDPSLEILRNTKTQFIWFLHKPHKLYKDLFWWLDHQINDLEWRFGGIHSDNATIWSIQIFKIYPRIPLEKILKDLNSRKLLENYDTISEHAKSYFMWDRQLDKFK